MKQEHLEAITLFGPAQAHLSWPVKLLHLSSLYQNQTALDQCWYLGQDQLHVDGRPVREKEVIRPAAKGHPRHWTRKGVIYVTLARDVYGLKHDPLTDDYRKQAFLTPYDVHHRCRNRRCLNPHHLLALRPEDHHKVHAGLLTEEDCLAVYLEVYHQKRAEERAEKERIWKLEEKNKAEAKFSFRMKRWWNEVFPE